PYHLVIIPIVHSPEKSDEIHRFAGQIKEKLSALFYGEERVQVFCDKRDLRGGEKSWGWIKKGVPLRLEVGLREIESGRFPLMRRDKPHKESLSLTIEELEHKVPSLLEEIQENLYQKALAFRKANTHRIDSHEEFIRFFADEAEGGGFALCHWNGDAAIEAKVKEELNVTIRCIPLDETMTGGPGRCLFTGEPSPRRVLFAKAY
ncbi:MAG TPA: His/Gly/Thr/Pro-type tRNA ligase C-terminal domain-containing protein, partial [Chlamydiales bacterium]|nr:His/Gly/Thr/Pro-type tRNA ligase C-terminal domain-containing protein [Chlamydiales bacterium]